MPHTELSPNRKCLLRMRPLNLFHLPQWKGRGCLSLSPGTRCFVETGGVRSSSFPAVEAAPEAGKGTRICFWYLLMFTFQSPRWKTLKASDSEMWIRGVQIQHLNEG